MFHIGPTAVGVREDRSEGNHGSWTPHGFGYARAPESLGPTSVPLGISDSGGSGESPLLTTAFQGAATIRALSTYNASLGLTNAFDSSFQLNAFFTFHLYGSEYDYWVQNVFEINARTHAGYFEDNVWNASSPGNSSFGANGVAGSGTVTNSSNGQYYGYVASGALPGARPTLAYPASFSVVLNGSVDGLGRPQVSFAFRDAGGGAVYDTVNFPFAAGFNASYGFSVDAATQGPSCPRCLDDVEFVLGGPYAGYQTNLSGVSDVHLELSDWTGTNFAAVPDADNYGRATAEGTTNGTVTARASPGGVPGAEINQGPFTAGPLWRGATIATVFVSVGTAYASGTVAINGSTTSFARGAFLLVLVPGTYTLTITVGSGVYTLAGVTLAAGDRLTDQVGAYPVVFLPEGIGAGAVWTVSLGNRTETGTGAITFGVANGTWTFVVAELSGETCAPRNGSIPINGTGFYQTIACQSTATDLGQEILAIFELPLGPVPLYVVLIGLSALGVVAAVLGGSRRRRRRRNSPPRSDLDWAGNA